MQWALWAETLIIFAFPGFNLYLLIANLGCLLNQKTLFRPIPPIPPKKSFRAFYFLLRRAGELMGRSVYQQSLPDLGWAAFLI